MNFRSKRLKFVTSFKRRHPYSWGRRPPRARLSLHAGASEQRANFSSK